MTNKTAMMTRIIDKLMLPNTVIFFLPNLDTMAEEKKAATSWTMFEIKGINKAIAGLYCAKITLISVMIIFIPLNCCIKWSSTPSSNAFVVTSGSGFGTGSCSLWWSYSIFCTSGWMFFSLLYIYIVLFRINYSFLLNFRLARRIGGNFTSFCSGGIWSLTSDY